MGFKFLLDSCLHVADDTEARAARDVDDAAPLVTAEGRWAATWAGSLDAARAAGASGLVLLCHLLLFRCVKEAQAESQLANLKLYKAASSSTGTAES